MIDKCACRRSQLSRRCYKYCTGYRRVGSIGCVGCVACLLLLRSLTALARRKLSQQLLLRPPVYNTQLEFRGRAVNPVACTMAWAQEIEGTRAERTRLACASKQPFPETACTNCTRSTTLTLTHALACTSLQHTDHQSPSATHFLTPIVFPNWQHLHP